MIIPIKIPYQFDPSTRPYQMEIWKHPARFKSLILHRKAGKTALALNKLIQQALLNPNRVFWYVAPTYKQAKEIVWRDPEMLKKEVGRKKYLYKEKKTKKNKTNI